MIRPARPDDVPQLLAMVGELAAYERAAHEVRASEADLAAALFGAQPAVFCHVAVAGDDPDGEVVGMALWFRNFSTWLGRHGLYLEDLYVRPHARRGGYGAALLAELARVAVGQGWGRLDWWVLDWNVDAHAFYRRWGAEPQQDWTVWRLEGDRLAALAEGRPQ